MLLILAIALGLRCALLSKESLWLDEVASWWFASDLGRALAGERTNPPLYYTLLHFWIRGFGSSEAALRSLSIIPGMLSVAMVYLLARKLFSTSIALGAAFYQAISSFQIYYSQEARTFALLEFFLLLAALALWNALHSRQRRRRVVYFSVYALAGTLSLYAHFIAVFFLAGFGFFVLLRRKEQLVAFVVSSLASVALFLPWLTVMLRAAANGGQHRSYLFLKLPQAYFSFLFGDTLIPLDEQALRNIRGTLLHSAPSLLGAIVSVAVLVPFMWLAWKRWRDGLTFALVSASAPVALAFLVSFKVMLFDERYLIAASPFLYMIVASAFFELWRWRTQTRPAWQRWSAPTALAVYCLLLLVSLGNYFLSARFGREQWREVTAYIESPGSAKTAIIFDPSYLHHCYEYYQRRRLPSLSITENARSGQLISTAALAHRAAGYESVWLLHSHSDNDAALNLLRAQFREESHRTFSKGKGIEAFLFRNRTLRAAHNGESWLK
jgi:uncharacterized membrane protein